MKNKISIHWFRRDLRLDDNRGLTKALNSEYPILPIFIFDIDILELLPEKDKRVSLIHDRLRDIKLALEDQYGSSLLVLFGEPSAIFSILMDRYQIQEVFTNEDYEPSARKRDEEIRSLLKQQKIKFHSCKDQVIFEKQEVVKKDKTPYLVYTAYMKSWKDRFQKMPPSLEAKSFDETNFLKTEALSFPELEVLGFEYGPYELPALYLDELHLNSYEATRDFPAKDGTSGISVSLRFGLISVRSMVKIALELKDVTFLNELIWREFFMQWLYHFPKAAKSPYKSEFEYFPWMNQKKMFRKWCEGKTGYPIVDAGMRQLNETGLMHNRVRMVVASFLCKHLLIDWRWGEAYFAQKLLDYDQSANVGNWQWVAGCGVDAAPYFRIFNPTEQIRKFDKDHEYIRKWVTDLDELTSPHPIVEHKEARLKALPSL